MRLGGAPGSGRSFSPAIPSASYRHAPSAHRLGIFTPHDGKGGRGQPLLRAPGAPGAPECATAQLACCDTGFLKLSALRLVGRASPVVFSSLPPFSTISLISANMV